MRKIKMLVDYKHYKQGQIYEVDNNEAWGLEEAGVATRKLRTRIAKKKTRMMEAGQDKSYKTK